MLQVGVHYGLHLFLPGLVAWIFFGKNWKKAWFVMLLAMLVDLDHLLADPVFDPNRCSIGFHLLHSHFAIGLYFILSLFPLTRVVAIGLLLHMLVDFQDCIWM